MNPSPLGFLRARSLKHKLALLTFVTCVTTLLLTGGVLIGLRAMTLRQEFAAELKSLGALLASQCSTPVVRHDRKAAAEVLHPLADKPHITSAALFDGDGSLLAQLGEPLPPGISATNRTGTGVQFTGAKATVRLPVRLPEGKSGRLELAAVYGGPGRLPLRLYAVAIGATLVASFFMSWLLSFAFQRLFAGPIVALAGFARTVSESENFSRRAPQAGTAEVGLLTYTFNRLLDQIEARDKRLWESQQRYEVAVLGSSDGLWDWDLVAGRVHYSARWKQMLGFEDSELENSLETFRERLHADDLAPVQARITAYLEGQKSTYQTQFRALHKDGIYRWILARGVALRDGNGKPFRFAGSHTDITDRIRAEEEIRHSRAMFASLVNSIHGMVWEANPETMAMEFVSEQSEAMLGYPANRWLEDPKFWEQLIHPEDRATTLEACRRGVAAGKPFQLEFRMLAADGRTVWMQESISVELAQGRPVRLRGVAIDITEQKLAAEKIQRMQRELVDASRVAGMAEVATGVLHNVGNVLNSVNISASLVVEQLRKSKAASLVRVLELLRSHRQDLGLFMSEDPKGRQLPAFLEAVAEQLIREQELMKKETQGLQKNIEHIKQIVTMQQTYAKVSGVREEVMPREIVEDALRMAGPALTRHQVELVREFDVVPPVQVDRHLVLQILVNLINNARQAMESRAEGRQLRLRIAHRSDRHVRIEVSDNGMGIAPENLTRIFQHGFTTKKNGHGFGLHSGANAAKGMGGSLRVHSGGPGTGACFILELPLTVDAEQSEPVDAGQQLQLSGH